MIYSQLGTLGLRLQRKRSKLRVAKVFSQRHQLEEWPSQIADKACVTLVNSSPAPQGYSF